MAQLLFQAGLLSVEPGASGTWAEPSKVCLTVFSMPYIKKNAENGGLSMLFNENYQNFV